MDAMKFLLISALVLSVGCLVLALFHWVHLRRDLKEESQGVSQQRSLWLEFPRPYTRQGQRHQRRLFVYLAIFVILLIVLLVFYGTGS